MYRLSNKTDIPALSAGATAGAISMFVTAGPYVLLNMMTSVTLMLLILAYVSRNPRVLIESIAFSFVASFISLPTIGVMFERNRADAPTSSVSESSMLYAWLIMATVFLFADLYWQKRQSAE